MIKIKSLFAGRLNNGRWRVIISDRQIAENEAEVRKIIRQEGLQLDGNRVKLNENKELIEIHAD